MDIENIKKKVIEDMKNIPAEQRYDVDFEDIDDEFINEIIAVAEKYKDSMKALSKY